MRSKLSMVTAMIIFGSIGTLVKNINLSPLEIALMRSIIGSLFLAVAGLVLKIKISIKDIRASGLLLILSGASMGLNWIALFQGYRYTTVSNAILGYYFAPIFVILLSPIVLKEKITFTKIICTLTAILGLFLIINTDSGGGSDIYKHGLGIAYAILGAILYATVILTNKYIKNLSGFEATLLQLIIAALVLLPVVLLKSNPSMLNMGTKSWINIFLLGIVHTGIAYLLYFKAIKGLSTQSISILSYIDPITSVTLALIFLGEDMTLIKAIGGILILGSIYFAENITGQTKATSAN